MQGNRNFILSPYDSSLLLVGDFRAEAQRRGENPPMMAVSSAPLRESVLLKYIHRE
jgi:hypothetical protein